MAANNPTVGTGVWSIISGVGGSVATPSSPTSTFSGVAGTTYTLRWTISNSPCTASTDDVVITLSANPTTANAGPDQNVCATSATLAANTPTSGTGAWSIVSGTGGSFVNAASPTSTFNGTAGTTYTLRWTISNSPCTASADDVVITLTSNPTTANAGVDQTLCNVTSVTMAGNAVNTGTGTWTQVNGPNTATITSPNLPTTTMTGLVAGVYTFQWTIANAPCTASSDQVTITINAAPVMTTQPTNQSVALNGTATFTAAASGTPAPTVKWQVSTDGGANYTDLSGQTSTTLTLSNVTAGMNGNRYRAVFANSCITINSNAATLTIGCVSSLTVNNTGDGSDATPGNGVCETATGNGVCTLRAALQEANALTTCTPFTINFGVTGTIPLSSNLPVIAHPNLTITGPGANQLTVDGASSYQPFIIGGGNYAVTLSGLKVANGRANGGAGLLNLSTGTVNVNNLSFEGNQVTNSTGGGGIRHDSSSGTLNVTGSTFRNNSAIPTGGGGTAGGGISNASTGTVNVTNCTFNGNRGTLGGGIHNQVGGTINVTNCTLVGNSAEGVNSGGGGINNNSGTATVTNTIAVGNTASSNPDLRGTFTTSNNLTGSQTTALLGTLGNYGGTTDTYPLLPGSPAINAGTSSGAPATDQRGVARPQQTGVDIGAIESRGFTLAVNSGNNQSTVAGSNFTNSLQVTVTSSNSEPVDGGQVTFIPPGSGATASVAGSPATISSGVASSGTVTANLIIGGPYNVTATANGNSPTSFSLTNTNSPPSFTPASTITRQQGSPAGAAIMIGTVSDAQTAVGSLVVTQISGGTATGITATNITNTTGTITAQISASCMATAGTVRFQVSDGSATGTGDFQVNITANTMPTLMYGNITATAGGATSNSPTTATDNGSIDSYSVFGQGNYTGNISVNSSGVVSFSNAAPTGTHTITIRATDNCGASKDAMFTVTVNCQNITVTPPTEHYASLNVPFSQNFTQSGAVGTATFTLQSGTLPLGIQLQPNGTLSGTTNQSGDFPITVKVTDSNSCTGVSAMYTIETGVQIPFSAKISDPLACTGENNILSVHAEVVNPNNVAANLNFNASLPATLTGSGASCQSSYGTCTVNAGSVTVTGSLPANQTVTIDYKVRVANGTPQGTQLCVTSTASLNNAAPAMVQACTILNCPTGAPANVLAGGQKAGSLLVFPYYTSKTAPRRDTRLTISNTGTQTTYAHIFLH
ncbi:MAG: choice-of-anchor Q domain-containing protein [Blastocatellia bacterium]